MTKTYVVTDLLFGDSGKGTITDYLASTISGPTTVVRYNGGPQAAHNVVAEGVHHTFAQFGSGVLAGAATHLSHHMLINPLNLFNEHAELVRKGIRGELERLTVEEGALIITPYHVAMNRALERSRIQFGNQHGSTGEGVGITMSCALSKPEMAIRVSDLRNLSTLESKLRYWNEKIEADLIAANWKVPESFSDEAFREIIRIYSEFAKQVKIVDNDYVQSELLGKQNVIFEGAQGVLLDEWYGFHPYTTWSTTTSANAKALIGDYTGEVTEFGVIRSYATRHGAGPFPTEGTFHAVEQHNERGEFQGGMRIGAIDFVLLKYALEVNGGVDWLVVTHMDALQEEMPACTAYDVLNRLFFKEEHDLKRQEEMSYVLFNATPIVNRIYDGHFTQVIKNQLHTEIAIESYGPNRADKVIRRPY